MKKLIFVVFILTSCQYNDMGVISNALPIQFWPIGGNTYNQQVNGFVRAKPYTHQWQCDDPIKLQVGNEPDPSKAYTLKILDRDGATIEILDYTESFLSPGTGQLITPALDLPNTGFTAGLTPWAQNGNILTQAPWTWVSPGVISSNGTAGSRRDSYYLRAHRPDGFSLGWPAGNYTIRIQGHNASTGPDASLLLYEAFSTNDSGTTINHLANSAYIPTGDFDISLSFTLTEYWLELGFDFFIPPPGNVLVMTVAFASLTAAPLYETAAEYDLEFDAKDLSTPICDADVQFVIQQNGVDQFESDYHRFNSKIAIDAFNGSKLILYKSIANYASLNYPNNGNYFAIRLPCKFFTRRTVTAQTSINLTSKVVDTSDYIKFQKHFELPVLPDYILDKFELILGHSVKGSLIIDGIGYTRQEAVNRSGPSGDIKFPEQMADVWLTEKNTGVRNII